MKMIYVVPNDIPMSVTHFLLLAAMPFFVSSPAWPADCSFPQPEQVIVYDEIDCGGACRLLDIGYYRDPASFGLPTDSISSIDVGANARAVLYEHNEFRGRQAHLEGGFNYGELGRENDKTSSIEIFRKEGGAAATSYLNEYPSKRKTYWSEQAQGLAKMEGDGSSQIRIAFLRYVCRLISTTSAHRLRQPGFRRSSGTCATATTTLATWTTRQGSSSFQSRRARKSPGRKLRHSMPRASGS